MLRCLFCDAELSDTLLRAGCCPVCGGRLMWPDEDADDPSTRPASETPAPRDASSPPKSPRPPSVDTPPSIAPPTRAISPLEPAKESTSPEEPPAVPKNDQRGSASAGGESPFSADQLPPELLARVTSAWSGAFDSREFPRNTIKVSSLDTADAPPLVIRPRQLGGRDRPQVDQPDYELLEIIGEGGVGVVYSARQSSIDRMVAVKMLRPGSEEAESPQDKFLAEAVVTGELEHPNIVPIYDLGSSSDGTLFYSMKRVHGVPWDRAMSAKSLPENIEILMKVCDAVAFAHSRGVIHRDLKPENVMLGGFGEVLVMDWGIALSWSTDGRAKSIRQSATMGGTPAYMSPEMATGPLDRIGVPSDVYLLGGILYEIVTGLSPHTGKTVMDCLYAAAANDIQRSDAGGELVEIALQAMSTDPADRFQSVQEFQDAIRSYQSHAESIVLSSRAQDDLQLAVREQKYEVFARSLFAFEEAVALWSGNEAAAKGVIEARRAYAEAALNKEDYELGLSLIDAKESRHARLAEQLAAGQKEQQTRTQRIRVLKQVAVALVIAMMTGGALALVEINEKRARAESEQQKAVDARKDLQNSIDENTDLLTQQVSLLGDVAKERDRATLALQEEAASRAAAQLAQRREQQEKYVAQIGLAAERVEANAFDQAAELLENYRNSPLAHWEWARLWYICRPHRSMHEAGGVVQFSRYLPGAGGFMTITRGGEVSVWSSGDGAGAAPLAQFSIGDAAAECALSPDARRLAVAAPGSAVIRVLPLTLSDAGIPQGIDAAAPSVTLSGHTGGITSLEFSRDGAQLLSGSLDHTARLWDVDAARSLLEFQGHNWPVWQAAFSPSPDHRIMATAGQDGRVIVWSTVDGSLVTDFNEHQGPVYCVAFSPDGETVATAGEDRRILVWDWMQVQPLDLQKLVADGSRPNVPYRALQGHRSSIYCLAFAPSGSGRLVSGGGDNTLMVWDAAGASGSAIVPLRGHSRRITTCTFSTDGLQVLSGSEDRKWGLWDVAGFQEVNQLRSTSLRGHENGILAARFAPHGDGIVTASLDRTARVWDAAAGRERATLREGHEYLATSAVLLPGGERLLTAGGDNSARLWDMIVGAQTGVLNGTGRHAAIAVSADGRFALTGAPAIETIDEATQTSQRIYARLWDLEHQTVVREFSESIAAELVESQPMSAVSAAAISPDGSLFYTGHSDGQGRLWREDGAPVLLQGHTRSVTAAAFVAPDGARLLTASGDQTVAQWDVATGRERLDLSMRHDGWVSSLSLTDDGRTAVTSAEDGLVRIWDVGTARELARLSGSGGLVDGLAFVDGGASLLWVGDDGVLRISDPQGIADERTINAVAGDWVYSAAMSPDGDRLAVMTGSGWLSLIDFATGSVTETIRVEGARDAAFAAEGDRVICGGADGKLRIIGVAADRQPRDWQAHSGMIHEVAVSPDGAVVASAGDDGFARVWNATTGELVHELRGQGGAVTALAWSESGEFLTTGCADGSVQWWTADGNLLQSYTAHEGGVGAVVFSPDGTRLVSGGIDRVLRVWVRGSTTPVAVLDAHEGAIRSLEFSPDGATLASLAADRAVRLWNTSDWKWAAEIPKGRGMSTHPIGTVSADGSTVLAGNSGERLFRVFALDRGPTPAVTQRHEFRTEVGAIWSATLTRDGASVVTVGGDAARVWNPASGRELLTMRPHNVVSAVAYSPDGTQVVTGSWDRSARIWDAATGRMLRQLTGGHAGSVTQAAWLPEGGLIITAGDDGAIRIWDAATGMLDDASLQESGAAIVSLTVSRNGATAATVSADNIVRIWDVSTRALIEELTAAQLGIEGEALLCCALGPEGRLLAVGTPSRTVVQIRGDAESRMVLSGHTAAIRAVAFSPDGKRLVTGSEDFTARVWDVTAGKEMLSLARHTATVTAVDFSADGRNVLTAGMDGLAIVWGGDAIAPSVQTSRDRFDYRIGDGVTALDPLAALNAPSTPSPAGLRVRIELGSEGDAAGRMGKLRLLPQESSTATAESHDAPAGELAVAEEHGAHFEFSEDARRLEIAFDERAGWTQANAVLRSVAFEAAAGESSVAVDEMLVETVTIAVLETDGLLSDAHVSSIEIYILPAAATDAGSVLQDVEQVLKTLKSREAEQ